MFKIEHVVAAVAICVVVAVSCAAAWAVFTAISNLALAILAASIAFDVTFVACAVVGIVATPAIGAGVRKLGAFFSKAKNQVVAKTEWALV